MPHERLSLPARVVIAHESDEMISTMRQALPPGIEVFATCATLRELADAYVRLSEGVVISGVHFPDGDALQTLIRVASETAHPVVIVTAERTLSVVEQAARDHVMAYLLEPPTPAELSAAVALAHLRFLEIESLRAEVKDLRDALERRKLTERAKLKLMSGGLTEERAYATLRQRAQDQRVKIHEIAAEILDDDAPRRD